MTLPNCFHLRISDELRNKIRILALAGHRSMNSQILYMLEEYLKGEKKNEVQG